MMDLHKIFEKAQQEASKSENTYQTAFEKTGYALVLDPPKEKYEIKTSQQDVEVSHEWNFSHHRYEPDKIRYDMSANLSELTPQQILQHFSHASEMVLEASYHGLKIPLTDLKKYPVLDEAIKSRRQKEGKKLEKLIELMRPVTDMRRSFSKEDFEQLKKKAYSLPTIEIWSNFESGKNPQAVAYDLINERALIERLKKEEEKAETSIKALSGPRYAEQAAIVNQRLDAIRKESRDYTPLSLGRIRAYKKILYGEDEGREVEIELKRLYGTMKLELNIFPPEPVVRVYKQEFRANPHFNIPETGKNAILAGPSEMGISAFYKEKETVKGSVSLSWPLWVNMREGKFKLEPSTTSVKADLSQTDSKLIENILTDMEQLTNNISKK